MRPCAVLHVTSIPGGGVDRHVRDIRARGRRPHLSWHCAEGMDVLEQPDAGLRFLPLDRGALQDDPDALAPWLRERGVGLVHLHSLGRPARARATSIARALDVPTAVTLHDVLFLRHDAFLQDTVEADPAWLDEVAPVLRDAARVLAPSRYIAELAERHVHGLRPEVIPNGIAPVPARTATRHPAFGAPPRRVVAVLGAIGPHKGSRLLEALAPMLRGSGTVIVVIGYMDSQAWPGWFDEHLFVHGPFEEPDAAALLHAYGADVVLFPNTAPESFSYALSEAWAARVPVIVPPYGALGERVREHGGGWLLPEGFGAGDVAALLARLDTEDGRREHVRVKSFLENHDPRRIPTLDAMTDALEDLYRRFGVPPTAPLDVASLPAQHLLAAQLDAGIFRQELVRLTQDVNELHEARRRARDFERDTRAWIAKLEADVATVQAELRQEVARREALERTPLTTLLRARISAWLPAGLKRALGKGRDAGR